MLFRQPTTLRRNFKAATFAWVAAALLTMAPGAWAKFKEVKGQNNASFGAACARNDNCVQGNTKLGVTSYLVIGQDGQTNVYCNTNVCVQQPVPSGGTGGSGGSGGSPARVAPPPANKAAIDALQNAAAQ